jgi:hypothetical protein
MNSTADHPGDSALKRPGGPSRRWTVLFIGDHGRVIAFKRVKTLIGLAVAALVLTVAALVVLMVVNQTLHGRSRELQQRLEASQQKVLALRQERDLLTAHVALAETRMRETLAGMGRPTAAVKEPERTAEVNAPSAQEASGAQAPPEPQAVPANDFKPPVGAGESISVEDVRIRWDGAERVFNLGYRVVNTGQGGKPLRGHVIVVMKGEDLQPDQWLSMPRVDLPKGRPTGRQKGYTFSISRQKSFSHTVPAPKTFPAFSTAVLYVFATDGQLLLAKDYEIEVPGSGG